MIRLDVEQGSAEWHVARLGIPTASQFHRLLTPKTRKLGAGATTYMHELLAEWLIGIPAGPEAKSFIARGNDLEPWAVSYYELQRSVTTEKAGVCLRDDRMVGCSPDRLVGADGGLELKCPGAPQHVANLLDMQDDYFAQVQGNLYVTGRRWWDLMSYHPEIPAALVRVERDEGYIAALDTALGSFVADLLAARARLIARGAEPATSLAADFAATITTTGEI